MNRTKCLRGLLVVSMMIHAGNTQNELLAAEWISFPVLGQAEVHNGSREPGVLVDFGDLSRLEGQRILYAKLRLSFGSDTCVVPDNIVEVRVVRKSASLSQLDKLVSWDEPGGELVDSLQLTAGYEQAKDGVLELLLNEVVQAWANRRIPNNGLLVTSRERRCVLGLTSNPRFAGSGWGELSVLIERPLGD